MNSHHSSNGSHLQVAIDYILKDEKTMNGLLTGSANCIKEKAYECMKETKRLYGKMDKRQGYHLIISFEENECDENTAMKVIQEFVQEYLASDYEVVYAVHNNTDHLHGHIIWNSVRFTDGYKYHYKKGDWEHDIQPRVDRICAKYNLSTLEQSISKPDKKEWDQLKDGPFVWNEQIKKDINACIMRAADYQMFIQMLEKDGYEVKQGKYLAVKPPGMARFRRTKTLGPGYSEKEIRDRISKESIMTYSRTRISRAPRIRGYKAKRIKRRKLTGLQKQYFRMMYRLGKIKKRPYSQVWKYKKDVKKFNLLQRQYMFLAKYDITNVEQIKEVQQSIRNRVKLLQKAYSVISDEIGKKQKIFDAVAQIQEEKKAAIFYKMGDKTFEESARKVDEAKKVLADAGMTLEDAQKVKQHYTDLIEANKQETKKLRKEINVGYKIIREEKVREENRLIEQQRKQELDDQNKDKKYVKRK